MPATTARAALVTQQYRWDLQQDGSVLTLHPRARDEEAESYCSNAVGGAAINSALLSLLKSDGQLLEVNVNPCPDGIDFSNVTPTVHIVHAALGITADRLLVGLTTETRPDGKLKGTMLLW